MKKQIVSAYFPYSNEGNRYTANVQECIRSAGIKIVNLRRYMFPLKDFFACKIFNFNWIEDRIVDNAPSAFKQRIKYIRMCLTFTLIKLKGGKIIWTMHNKLPHSIKNRKYKVKLMRKIARRASVVVIHCKDSMEPLKALCPKIKEEKVRLINHPSYIGSYTPSGRNVKENLGIPQESKVFLFMGAVSKYKNIELLISAFKELSLKGIKLVIAGRAEEGYAAALSALAGDCPDIIFDNRFIPDDEVADYYAAADIVVLPYDIENSLNSGSVYMSFSLKTTVVCPQIGTINQLKDSSFVYGYSYSDSSEHGERLKEALQRVAEDLKRDENILKEYGQRAYEYMLKEHSSESISADYGRLYAELAGGR